MIISRTPFRISFFGGGTDYPAWYEEHGGAVLATTIDKYCYLTCRFLPPFFEHRLRIVYSKVEVCQHRDEIAHPVVREILTHLDSDRGLEIHHDGDLPARSGIGSSSAFAVGLLHALYALKGDMPSKEQLATEGIYIEREKLKETVGSQDQVLAAYGGFNNILFLKNGQVDIRPMTLPRQRIEDLDSHLMLFYTGIKRTASNIAQSYVNDIKSKEQQLHRIGEMVEEGIGILSSGEDLSRFGHLLHDAWTLKRSLGDKVSNPSIEELYEQAMSAGAWGGKVTGAGGGGFLLLCVPPSRQDKVRERLKKLIYVPFSFEHTGSQIIFYDPGRDYLEEEGHREKVIQFEELDDSEER
jgi:D-glycero-alpha-D-manno-heptose-7-phosphate kinase